MEENTSASFQNSPSDLAMSISSGKQFVFVPFQWERKKTETGNIFYTSPSGRVLLSIKEVMSYFSEKESCKCYIDNNLNLYEVFSFDPFYTSLNLPPIKSTKDNESYCEKFWLNCIPKSWDKCQVFDLLASFFKDYISKSEFLFEIKNKIDSLDILIYLVYKSDGKSESNLNSSPIPMLEENGELMAILNSKDFIVTKSGQIYPRLMTDSQFKHFICELVEKIAFELSLPQDFFVIFSRKTKATQKQNQLKTQVETKVNHSSTDQKSKSGKQKIFSKEKFEVRVENLKAYQQKYQREYRQQQKLKYLVDKTHQKEQPPLRRSNRITAKGSKHVTSTEFKTNRRSSNKLNFPKELDNALQLILKNSQVEFCSNSY